MIDRRHLIQAASLASIVGSLPRFAASQPLKHNPFKLGVASGSPTPDGVVLWTKLLSDGWFSSSMGKDAIPVRWEIAHDESFKRIALQGTSQAVPELAHAVHVEARGLESDRWYHYRFMLGDAVSPVGRTRTAPAVDATPAKLRFAFASCQRWEHGYYAAYLQMLRDDPDLVLFLGDYIYEYASPKNVPPSFVRTHTLRHARTLDDYRDRYALHRSDPALQAMHAACPWMFTWDDHEVENDYAGDQAQDLQTNFLERRAAAYQAFYEHMPIPLSQLKAGLASLGQPDAVRVTQRLSWGQLASFHMLDCRQYRDPQACNPVGRGGSRVVRASQCEELKNPNRTMLGKAQETWLSEGFGLDTKRRAAWSVVGQSSLFSRLDSNTKDAEQNVWTDGWDGYPLARERLTNTLQTNPDLHPVLIGGDVHYGAAATVKADFTNTETIKQSKAVATEFCGTSISSSTNFFPERISGVFDKNPHLAFSNAEKRGYTLVDVTVSAMSATYMGVEDVRDPSSVTKAIAKFNVQRGHKEPTRTL